MRIPNAPVSLHSAKKTCMFGNKLEKRVNRDLTECFSALELQQGPGTLFSSDDECTDICFLMFFHECMTQVFMFSAGLIATVYSSSKSSCLNFKPLKPIIHISSLRRIRCAQGGLQISFMAVEKILYNVYFTKTFAVVDRNASQTVACLSRLYPPSD